MTTHALLDSVNDVRRRVRWLSAGYGAGIMLATAVGLLAAVVSFDWLFNLPAWPRFVLMLAALAVLGWAATRWLWRPVHAGLLTTDVAGRIERVFPQFEDRLRSTLDFQSGGGDGSMQLREQTARQAADIAASLDLRTVIDARPATVALSSGAVAVIVLVAATLMLAPSTRAIIASRLLHPWSGLAWPKRVQIEPVGTLPIRVAAGDSVPIRLRLTRGDSASMRPVAYVSLDGGEPQLQYLTRAEDGVYTAALDARLETGASSGQWKLWVVAGDDRFDAAPIRVVPKLRLTSATLTITPPAYVTSHGRRSHDVLLTAASVVEGSSIRLDVGFNRPLAGTAAVLEAVDAASAAALRTIASHHGSTASFAATLSPMTQGSPSLIRFRVRATDEDGLSNDAGEELAIRVERDQSPSITIELPQGPQIRHAGGTLALSAIGEDDFGLASIDLHVRRVGARGGQWTIPLMVDHNAVAPATTRSLSEDTNRARIGIDHPLSLTSLSEADLKAGDVLEVFLVARDRFELEGRTHAPVESAKLRVSIVDDEALRERAREQLRALRRQVSELRRAQVQAADQTKSLDASTDRESESWLADLARAAQQQSSAAGNARQASRRAEELAAEIEQSGAAAAELAKLAKDAAERLGRAAEQSMKAAGNEIGRAGATPDPQARRETIARARSEQQRAIDQLDEILKRLDAVGSLGTATENLERLTAEQREVTEQTRQAAEATTGKKPEELTPEQKAASDAAAQRQAALAEKTDALVASMEKLSEQMKASDPVAAEAMKAAVETAKQMGVSSQQRQASQQTQQNRQQAASESQARAQAGLDATLEKLKDAERLKARQLQEQLTDLAAKVAGLVRRQAGHNFDTLGVAGEVAVTSLPEAERVALLAMAQRKADALPPVPPIATVTAGQELTHRNALDIAKIAGSTDGAEQVGSRLVRAAAAMERAVPFLRGKQPREAYSPHQVEALTELLAAREKADLLKKQADDAERKQSQEEIRAALEKVRDAQQKQINDETKAVESKRRPDGTLARVEAIRLGGLVKAQQEVGGQMSAVEARLASLKSDVFVWAAKDVVSSMTESARRLAAGETSVAAQLAQTTAVDSLDRMIAQLAEQPPDDDEFEAPSDNGGGGEQGGQQAAKLPPAAELKLVRALQLAINERTKPLDGRPAGEEFSLVGERQRTIRGLLEQLLQKSGAGDLKLGEEPKNEDQLPEELDPKNTADAELDQELLGGNPDAAEVERDVGRVGVRMARSRQRVGDNHDAGAVTQSVQAKILEDLDELIKDAEQQRRQRQKQSQSGQPKPGDPNAQPKPGEPKPGSEGQSQDPGAPTTSDESHTQGGSDTTGPERPIEQMEREWGSTSPRLRAAVIESKNEDVVAEYRRLIERYYRAVATESSGR